MNKDEGTLVNCSVEISNSGTINKIKWSVEVNLVIMVLEMVKMGLFDSREDDEYNGVGLI